MSLLLNAVRRACANAKPPIYSGAPARRPLDAKLEDTAWVASAKREAAVMMIDLKKNAAAVTSAGSLAWVSPAQAAAMGGTEERTVLLGRREKGAAPPSFLNERYAKVANDTWCFATSVDVPDAPLPAAVGPVAGFVGLLDAWTPRRGCLG